MRNKLVSHQYVLFGVLFVLILFKIVTGSFIFGLDILWWLLGAILGFLFVFTDSFLFGLLMRPEAAMRMRLREIFAQKKFPVVLTELLNEAHEQRSMIMRSFLFLVVYMVLALLTITSVGSPFGRGFILGIGIHLVFDFVYDYLWETDRFNIWFWQIKREFGAEEKRGLAIAIPIVFAFLAVNF